MSKNNDDAKGMDFLQSMPRRWVTIYIPITLFVIVLLFPFYWMTAHMMMAGIVYATEFVGIGSKRKYEEEGLLWDRLGLHLFFMVSWFLTW